jgi:hypothetical protein
LAEYPSFDVRPRRSGVGPALSSGKAAIEFGFLSVGELKTLLVLCYAVPQLAYKHETIVNGQLPQIRR